MKLDELRYVIKIDKQIIPFEFSSLSSAEDFSRILINRFGYDYYREEILIICLSYKNIYRVFKQETHKLLGETL